MIVWVNLAVASGVLIVVMGVWFAVHYWLNPHVESPDTEARVVGECGDSMEIRVRFEGNRVADISYRTNGCTYMVNCLSAVTLLAKGKTVHEIFHIDADIVKEAIGGLPKDYMHCAIQAADLLREAVDGYLSKQRSGQPSEYFTSHSTCQRPGV
jgi:NifU-like protein involved in Fe-S cluster formation